MAFFSMKKPILGLDTGGGHIFYSKIFFSVRKAVPLKNTKKRGKYLQ
jgi:hypothetical protein